MNKVKWHLAKWPASLYSVKLLKQNHMCLPGAGTISDSGGISVRNRYVHTQPLSNFGSLLVKNKQ